MQEQNQIKLMIENSLKFAKALRSNVLETEHLLFGVLSIQDSLPSKILGMFGVTKETYAKVVKSYKKTQNETVDAQMIYSKNVSNILSKAYKKDGTTTANISDVLYYLISKKEFKSYIILASVFKLDIQKIVLKLKPSLSLYGEKKQETKITYTENLPDELKDLGEKGKEIADDAMEAIGKVAKEVTEKGKKIFKKS